MTRAMPDPTPPSAYIVLASSIALGVAGQFAFKAAMAGDPAWLHVARHPSLWLGLLCYGLSTLGYLHCLRHFPLSIAVPTLAVGHALVAVLATQFQHERLAAVQWSGVALILVGVVLLHRPHTP
jgi:multidrug transporter EmrE-like cation transporter